MTKHIEGQKFGKLTALEPTGSSKYRHLMWRCECDCGNFTTVRGDCLRNGGTKSCGCDYVRSNQLPEGEASFNALIRNMKRSAKNRGYGWDLTKKQVRELTLQPCFYCGKEPAQVYSSPDYNGAYVYNGLDRFDNGDGYFEDNVVPCCGRCNRKKGKWHRDDLLAWIKTVYEHIYGG